MIEGARLNTGVALSLGPIIDKECVRLNNRVFVRNERGWNMHDLMRDEPGISIASIPDLQGKHGELLIDPNGRFELSYGGRCVLHVSRSWLHVFDLTNDPDRG